MILENSEEEVRLISGVFGNIVIDTFNVTADTDYFKFIKEKVKYCLFYRIKFNYDAFCFKELNNFQQNRLNNFLNNIEKNYKFEHFVYQRFYDAFMYELYFNDYRYNINHENIKNVFSNIICHYKGVDFYNSDKFDNSDYHICMLLLNFYRLKKISFLEYLILDSFIRIYLNLYSSCYSFTFPDLTLEKQKEIRLGIVENIYKDLDKYNQLNYNSKYNNIVNFYPAYV